MKRLKSILLFFTLLQFIFAGCSSIPTESDAKKIFETIVSEESKGRIELLEFKKTDGLNQNAFGQELYILEFNALIEFKEGGYKEINMEGVSFNHFYISDNDFFARYFEKGKTVKLKGKIEYEKTENGWRPSISKMTNTVNFSASIMPEDKLESNGNSH